MITERQRIEEVMTVLVAKPLAWVVYGTWMGLRFLIGLVGIGGNGGATPRTAANSA